MLTQPRWRSRAARPIEAGTRAEAELSPLSSLTLAPVSHRLAPGTPPQARTPAWSAQHLQGQSRRGKEPPKGCQIHGDVPDPSWHPFPQGYIRVTTPRNHVVPPSTVQCNPVFLCPFAVGLISTSPWEKGCRGSCRTLVSCHPGAFLAPALGAVRDPQAHRGTGAVLWES